MQLESMSNFAKVLKQFGLVSKKILEEAELID